MLSPFRKVYININSVCNYKCVNCLLSYDYRTTSREQLSATELRRVWETLEPLISDERRTICEISGGEPTLHPEFFSISEFLHNKKTEGKIYKVVLLSNVHKLAEYSFAKAAASMIDDVTTTIYSVNPQLQGYLTGVHDSLQHKIEAVENLLDLGVYVHIKTLVMKPTYRELPDIARFIGDKWGSRVHFTINATHFTGDALRHKEDLLISIWDAKSYIEDTIDIASSYGIKTSIFFPLCVLDPMYWGGASIDYIDLIRHSFSITPDGNLGQARHLLKEFLHKHPLCSSCPIKERCNWPWEEYIGIMGEEELGKGRQILDSLILSIK